MSRRGKMVKIKGGGGMPGMPKMRMVAGPAVPTSNLSIEVQKQIKNWQIIWPAYIDAAKTRPEGRCVPLSCAVKSPTCKEIVDVLKSLGFQAVEEPHKRYPRDILEYGRVRVLIKVEKKSVVEELPCKSVVLLKVCELIPKLVSRQASSSTAPAPSSQPNQSNKKSKKGKRK